MSRSKKDILRSLTGEESVVETPIVNEPTSVLSKVKTSITGTTDKVGITTNGSLTRTFFWGLVIGITGVMALGYWKDKISIHYSK